ncbi:hypothetical protein D3C80_909670 [compost metagenome]
MVDEGVDQRSRPVAGARMHDEPGGLDEHDQVFILIFHVERNVLALGFRVFRFRHHDLDAIAGMHLLFRLRHRLAVERNRALLDQGLQAAAGEVAAHLARQPGIEAAFGVFPGNQDFPCVSALFKGVVHSYFSDPSAFQGTR